MKADFITYLDGFSRNVQDIIINFELRNQIDKLSKKNILGALIEKYLDDSINLSPEPVLYEDGSVKLPGLDNHSMGTIFEDLLRKFNDLNNEEAGEHFTPRDVVKLMADLIFLPVKDKLKDSTYLIYDGACGTGGMLTLAEKRLLKIAEEEKKEISVHLFGQETNPETYAIAKADLLLKGEGAEAENIKDDSTLSMDAFPTKKFDFMLSNPPYGKSWKVDLEHLGGKKKMADPRFIINYDGDPEYSLVTSSSDGQMMFLVNKMSKMRDDTEMGSRIAEVHNGSSIFTGDAGSGESNIRRWMIENDWLEAIIALPTNMFYNTPIATYIWVLTNRKAEQRKGKVQLIDATGWSVPLRKNLGDKNCEFDGEIIKKICNVFMDFEETEESKIFDNREFGYWKVQVDRPLRLKVILSEENMEKMEGACVKKKEKELPGLMESLKDDLGEGPFMDYNTFVEIVRERGNQTGVKITKTRENVIKKEMTERDEDAEPVIKKVHKKGKAKADPIYGKFETEIDGEKRVVEYEPDSGLRDHERVPLLYSPQFNLPSFC